MSGGRVSKPRAIILVPYFFHQTRSMVLFITTLLPLLFSLKEAVSPQECPSDSLKLTAALRHLESEVRAYWIMQWQTVDPQVAPLSFGYDPSRRVLVGGSPPAVRSGPNRRGRLACLHDRCRAHSHNGDPKTRGPNP